MAGVVGRDPRPVSFWQLTMMKEGAERERWDRLALQTTALVNCHASKPVKYQSFHKYESVEQKEKSSLKASNIRGMKHLFPSQKEVDDARNQQEADAIQGSTDSDNQD